MADFEKKVRITVLSDRYDDKSAHPDHEKTEFKTHGLLISKSGRVTLAYEDGELLDNEKTSVELSFDLAKPGIVTMQRLGTVKTTMIFEQGLTHEGVYQTPFMPFALKILTHRVENSLLAMGRLVLDYDLELAGSRTDRTVLTVSIAS